MRAFQRRLAVALLGTSLALLTVAIPLGVYALRPGPAGRPALQVDATTKDLGPLRVREEATAGFTFSNRSSAALHLLGGASA